MSPSLSHTSTHCLAGPTMTRGGSPFIFKPVAVLACLRRRTRVSAQSLLTAVTSARESLGSDLSRGAGDYTPRDKPICAIRWARGASNDLPLGKQEMNMAFVASVDPVGTAEMEEDVLPSSRPFSPFSFTPLSFVCPSWSRDILTCSLMIRI